MYIYGIIFGKIWTLILKSVVKFNNRLEGLYNSNLCRPQWSRGYHTRHWIRGSRVQTQPELVDFSERKNPENDFLQKGSKAMGPA